MPTFETRLVLPVTPQVAFDYLTVPRHHEQLSPPDTGLVFVDPPERFLAGDRLAFKVLAWGMVQHIVHEIVELAAPERFVERQVQGPMRSWLHVHEFQPHPEGVTLVDRIDFEPPGGVIGMLMPATKILEHLEDGFAHRHERLRELLQASV